MSAASDYQRLRAHLAFLRMGAAAEALPGLLDEATKAHLSHSGFLERLLAVEVDAVEERRAVKSVVDVALPLATVPTATPDEPLVDLVERLSPPAGSRGLVFDDGRLVGIVTPADVARTIELRRLHDRPPSAASTDERR